MKTIGMATQDMMDGRGDAILQHADGESQGTVLQHP